MNAQELLELAKGEEHGPEGHIQDAGVLLRLCGHSKRRGRHNWWDGVVIEEEKRYNGKTGAGTNDTIQ